MTLKELLKVLSDIPSVYDDCDVRFSPLDYPTEIPILSVSVELSFIEGKRILLKGEE